MGQVALLLEHDVERVDRYSEPADHPARSTSPMPVSLFDLIWQWHERARQRRALRALDDRLLSDIGIGRAEAEEEARRPFWLP